MKIYFDEDNTFDKETEEIMNKAALLCLQQNGIDPEKISLSVTFADKDEIQRLNREYRNVDSVTDVLSFPQFDGDLEDYGGEEEINIGDVVICKEKAEEQAEEFGHSYQRESTYLFVHSVLHLLGYDHIDEEDRKEMRSMEEEVMGLLGITREA